MDFWTFADLWYVWLAVSAVGYLYTKIVGGRRARRAFSEMMSAQDEMMRSPMDMMMGGMSRSMKAMVDMPTLDLSIAAWIYRLFGVAFLVAGAAQLFQLYISMR